MNFAQLLFELNETMTLQAIADACDISSKGQVHDIIHGRQKTVSYEVGVKILAEHKRATDASRRAAGRLSRRNAAPKTAPRIRSARAA